MSDFDEKMKRFFEDFKDQIHPGDEIEEKMIQHVKNRNHILMRRKILTISASLVVAFLLAMSSVVPVFGRNGTLPQLISGIALEKTATSFTGTIETQQEILNQLKDQGLSNSDSIIILSLIQNSDVSLQKIIEMRQSGMGWGKILANLGVSTSTVQQTLEQASTQLRDQTRTQDQTQNQIGDQNQNQNQEQTGNQVANQNQEQTGTQNQEQTGKPSTTVLVIKGKVQNIGTNTITVNGTSILITDETIIRDASSLLQITDLKVDDDILVHALNDGNNNITAQTIQLFNSGNQNKNNVKDFFVINGTVQSITANSLNIDGTDISVNDETEVKAQGKSVEFTTIQIGDKVVVKAHSSATETIADTITITGVSQDTGNGNQDNKGNGSAKEYELRTTVISFDGTNLILKDFENTVIVNEDTKVEGQSSGRVDSTALQTDDTVQIHIRYDGQTYLATNIVILTSPEHKNVTFQGEISVIDLQNNVTLLKDNNLTFKITDLTKSNVDLNSLLAGDKVQIVGTQIDENTVNIQNINLINKGNSGSSSESPGNSGKKPDQPGKNGKS
jgi:hypothetical protein